MGYQLTEQDTKWIQFLKNNPHLQSRGSLGLIENNQFKEGCCLGARQWVEIDDPDVIHADGDIMVENIVSRISPSTRKPYQHLETCTGTLIGVYKKYNLRSTHGSLVLPVHKNDIEYTTLIEMNDSEDWTWLEIAEYIENNPDNVFVKWDT